MKISFSLLINLTALLLIGGGWAGMFHNILVGGMRSELLALERANALRVRILQGQIEAELNRTTTDLAVIAHRITTVAAAVTSPFSSAASAAPFVRQIQHTLAQHALMAFEGKRSSSSNSGIGDTGFLHLMCRFRDGAAAVARSAADGSVVLQVFQSGDGVWTASEKPAADHDGGDYRREALTSSSSPNLAFMMFNKSSLEVLASTASNENLIVPSSRTFALGPLWNSSVEAAAAPAPATTTIPAGATTSATNNNQREIKPSSLILATGTNDRTSLFFDAASSTTTANDDAALLYPFSEVITSSSSSSTAAAAVCFSFFDVQRLAEAMAQHRLAGEESSAFLVDGEGRVVATSLGAAAFDVINQTEYGNLLKREALQQQEAVRAHNGSNTGDTTTTTIETEEQQQQQLFHVPASRRCFAFRGQHACLRDVSTAPEYMLLREVNEFIPLRSSATNSSRDSNSAVDGLQTATLYRGRTKALDTVDKDIHAFSIPLHGNRLLEREQLRLFIFVPVGFFVNPIMSAVDVAIGVSVGLFFVTVAVCVLCLSVVAAAVDELSQRMYDPWRFLENNEQQHQQTSSSTNGKKQRRSKTSDNNEALKKELDDYLDNDLVDGTWYDADGSGTATSGTAASSPDEARVGGSVWLATTTTNTRGSNAPPAASSNNNNKRQRRGGDDRDDDEQGNNSDSNKTTASNSSTLSGWGRRLRGWIQLEEVVSLELEYDGMRQVIDALRGFMNAHCATTALVLSRHRARAASGGDRAAAREKRRDGESSKEEGCDGGRAAAENDQQNAPSSTSDSGEQPQQLQRQEQEQHSTNNTNTSQEEAQQHQQRPGSDDVGASDKSKQPSPTTKQVRFAKDVKIEDGRTGSYNGVKQQQNSNNNDPAVAQPLQQQARQGTTALANRWSWSASAATVFGRRIAQPSMGSQNQNNNNGLTLNNGGGATLRSNSILPLRAQLRQLFCCCCMQFPFVQNLNSSILLTAATVVAGTSTTTQQLQQRTSLELDLQDLITVTTLTATFCKRIIDTTPVTTIDYIGDSLNCCFRVRSQTQRSRLFVNVLRSIFREARNLKRAVEAAAAASATPTTGAAVADTTTSSSSRHRPPRLHRMHESLGLSGIMGSDTNDNSNNRGAVKTATISSSSGGVFVCAGFALGMVLPVDTSSNNNFLSDSSASGSSDGNNKKPQPSSSSSSSSSSAPCRAITFIGPPVTNAQRASDFAVACLLQRQSASVGIPLRTGIAPTVDISWARRLANQTGCLCILPAKAAVTIRPDLAARAAGWVRTAMAPEDGADTARRSMSLGDDDDEDENNDGHSNDGDNDDDDDDGLRRPLPTSRRSANSNNNNTDDPRMMMAGSLSSEFNDGEGGFPSGIPGLSRKRLARDYQRAACVFERVAVEIPIHAIQKAPQLSLS